MRSAPNGQNTTASLETNELAAGENGLAAPKANHEMARGTGRHAQALAQTSNHRQPIRLGWLLASQCPVLRYLDKEVSPLSVDH